MGIVIGLGVAGMLTTLIRATIDGVHEMNRSEKTPEQELERILPQDNGRKTLNLIDKKQTEEMKETGIIA